MEPSEWPQSWSPENSPAHCSWDVIRDDLKPGEPRDISWNLCSFPTLSQYVRPSKRAGPWLPCSPEQMNIFYACMNNKCQQGLRAYTLASQLNLGPLESFFFLSQNQDLENAQSLANVKDTPLCKRSNCINSETKCILTKRVQNVAIFLNSEEPIFYS